MPSAALVPHPATPSAIVRSLKVRIERSPQALRLAYVLEGEIGRLRIPERRAARAAERLWEHTCCELFIARPGESSYREYNFSPSTQWAAYEFEAYRARARALEVSPEIEVVQTADRLELGAAVPCTASGKLIVGVSAVIEERSGELSYWALRHAAGKPDFHHRDAFALELG